MYVLWWRYVHIYARDPRVRGVGGSATIIARGRLGRLSAWQRGSQASIGRIMFLAIRQGLLVALSSINLGIDLETNICLVKVGCIVYSCGVPCWSSFDATHFTTRACSVKSPKAVAVDAGREADVPGFTVSGGVKVAIHHPVLLTMASVEMSQESCNIGN